MNPLGLLLVLLNVWSDVGGSISQGEVDRHLEMGKDFLARGQLNDALTHYHAAVEGDPHNFLTYYKRGAVYLALGKSRQALQDFDRVLSLKSDFTAARLQRAKVLWKQGDLPNANLEFLTILQQDPYNPEATAALEDIAALQRDYQAAPQLVEAHRYDEAIDHLSRLIDFSPWSPELRELRAECYIALGDHMSAVSDMRASTKLLSDNRVGYYKLSNMLYRLGQVDEALKEIRECLKLDPDHKDCKDFYKKLRKISKKLSEALEAEEARDSQTCVPLVESVLKLEPDVSNVRFLAHHLLCKCYAGDTDPNLAIRQCEEALKIRREPAVLCDSAEAYLNGEMFDDAIREAKEAMEMDPSFQRAKDLHSKAQQRQKMAESRDYYKILAVPRNAKKQQIIKAYRKAAQKWHPDNFQDPEEKKRAQKKFIDIAAAKEVLTDEEKRAKFDSGEDPLDPESGKHSGSNPFHEFHQFHGSPFQFKFHFN